MSYAEYREQLKRRPGQCVLYTDGSASFRAKPLPLLYYNAGADERGRVLLAEAVPEVDVFFCPTTCKTVQSKDAVEERNRSSNTSAVACPVCSMVLVANSSQSKGSSYQCEFCKWSSREIPLQADKVTELVQGVKALEDADVIVQGAYDSLVQKYTKAYHRATGTSDPNVMDEISEEDAAEADAMRKADEERKMRKEKREMGGDMVSLGEKIERIEQQLEEQREVNYAMPKENAENDFDSVSDTLLGKADEAAPGGGFRWGDVTTLEQRFTQPAMQPTSTKAITPQRQQLLVFNKYRSLNGDLLVQPSGATSHVAFKMQRFAPSYIPSVTLPGLLELGPSESKSEFLLYLRNPNHRDIIVTLKPVADADTNATLALPDTPVHIHMYDQVEEQDALNKVEDSTNQTESDDPSVVGYRRLNKVGVCAAIIPHPENPADNIFCKFSLHMEAAPSTGSGDDEVVDIKPATVQVHLSFGPMDVTEEVA